MPKVEILSLEKKFAGTQSPALKDVSFEVEKGETIALIGESGCGKTTLLRLLAGLDKPTSGSIKVDGRQLSGPNRFLPAEKRRIGMVFQDYALFPHLRVRDNIFYGVAKKERKAELLNSLLQLTGLQGLEKRYPHELSGGQQQRVALARALAPQPDIMLLDEPFSNLDELLKSTVRQEVKDILGASGCTSILVTHDIKDAMATADRAVILRAGEIQQIGSPQELYQHPANLYVANFLGAVNVLPPSLLLTFGISPQAYKTAIIRPEAICLDQQQGWQATLLREVYSGPFKELRLEVGGQELKTFVGHDFDLDPNALFIRLPEKNIRFVDN